MTNLIQKEFVKKNWMEFQYPVDIERYRKISSAQQLKDLLEKEKEEIGTQKIHFSISTLKEKYLYANCNSCKSCLCYKKQDEQFKLFRFQTKHKHQMRSESNMIEQFIKSFPNTVEVKSLKSITQQKFNLSNARFYYYLNKIRFGKKTFQQLIETLNKQNYYTSYDPYPLPTSLPFPNYFLTISPHMIQLFQVYGDVCTFDLTYNCIKQIVEYEQNGIKKKKKWALGFFAGKFWTNRPIIFGIVLINQETSESFEKVISSFLEIVNKSNRTVSFITDQQNSIRRALLNLKSQGIWSGSHVIDSYHLIRTFRKKTKSKDLLEILRRLVLTDNLKQYEKLLSNAKQQIQNAQEAELIRNIEANSNQFCFCKVENFFHGLSLSTSTHQKLHDKFKDILPNQKRAVHVVKKALEFAQSQNQSAKIFKFSNVTFEDIFQNYDLKLLRYLTSQNVFKIIIKNYASGLQLSWREQRDLVFYVDNEKVSPQNKKFKCSCYYADITGLPCPHLLLVIKITKQAISEYVLERWKKNDSFTESKIPQQYIRKGRPRLSRRNMLR